MLKLVFDAHSYKIRDYDISFKQPSTKQVVESFGGYSSIFTVYGNSKETISLKFTFRKKDSYTDFLADLFSTTIKYFYIYQLNHTTKQFDLVGQYCFTGDFSDKQISDPIKKFKHEVSFSCVRVV